MEDVFKVEQVKSGKKFQHSIEIKNESADWKSMCRDRW
jgi:hypothetical protein